MKRLLLAFALVLFAAPVAVADLPRPPKPPASPPPPPPPPPGTVRGASVPTEVVIAGAFLVAAGVAYRLRPSPRPATVTP